MSFEKKNMLDFNQWVKSGKMLCNIYSDLASLIKKQIDV